MEQNIQTSSMRDFLTILFKHKGKILITFVTIVVTITIVTLTLPPVYEASSTLLVKFGRENIYRSEVGERGSWISLGNEEMVNSEIQILTSLDLIEKVVKAIGADRLYPVMAKAQRVRGRSEESLVIATVPKFKGSLSVEGVKKSNAIQVSFEHENPQIAAQAVNLLVDFFKERHLQVHGDSNSPFLGQQVLTYEKKLSDSENNLENFKQKYQVYSLPEQRGLLLQQLTGFDSAFKNTQNQVIELKQKLDALKKQMQNVPEDIPLATVTDRYGIVDNVKNILLNLQLKEQDLLLKYIENDPMVVSVRKEIMLTREYLQRQEEDIKKVHTTGRNVVYQELEKEMIRTQAELSAQKSKASALNAQISQLDKEIQALDLREKELQQLARDREITEKNYKTYLEKAEEARILEDMDQRKMANVSVIQKAAEPLSPVKPRKDLYIAFSFIFGLIGGLGLAFFSEYTKQGLSTPDTVERRLGIRVLIAIPYLEAK
jgi:polysaccharide chain length determinant protein (PEP-CTERM system associated)